MTIFNMHQAKSDLSKLVAKAEAGEEIVIARRGKPAVKLIPLNETAQPKKRREPGTLAHLQPIPDALFFDPMPEEELRAWEDGDEPDIRS
ncbi:type II toxin-antitoxin system Phd/YefM family antitoxin [Consotaella aegiceratis]|uniref:type II toxin-antitoxin system Phd/YefM family antitoxin n=1 Tax=Consotaella aegiceratis TaxID=3097961 RepID=UPI002F41A92E